MPAGPRFPPPPRPRGRLSGSQRGKLGLLIVGLVVLGAALGFAVSLVLPVQYAALTTVDYNIAGENTGDFLKTDRSLTTQLVLVTSRNVLQPVADANGISVEDLTKKVSAVILDQSDIIQIEVHDATREGGVNLANAIAKQYVTVSNASGPRGYVQAQLDAVRKQQAAPQPTGTTPVDTTALAARAAALQSQLDEMNLTANQASVLVPAYSVEAPAFPDRTLAAVTGGVCGLLIALMTVVTLSRRWTRS
jgi:hypothetical protein